MLVFYHNISEVNIWCSQTLKVVLSDKGADYYVTVLNTFFALMLIFVCDYYVYACLYVDDIR